QGLIDALTRRLESYGGQWRTDAVVTRVIHDGRRVTGTPSALDDSLAPPSHHTVYLACPTAPFQVRGGWDAAAPELAERMIDTVQARASGFRSTIVARAIRTPQDMADQLRWPGAHPMSLDVSLDQLGWMRPTRALSGHATPVAGLFITGAGTAPVGGIAGTPGRAAARGRPATRAPTVMRMFSNNPDTRDRIARRRAMAPGYRT
ncbi:MAG: phytoene desaturase family protein, partial [Pseudonocardiaceae bacterium]